MHAVAIIPAAGRGLRLKGRVSKPLVKINGIPVIILSLRAISRHPWVREIIVAANRSNIKAIGFYIKKFRIPKVSGIVLGGQTRRKSVESALSAIRSNADYVLIHDAVRPVLRQGLITRVLGAARHWGAAIAGVPVKATIKKVTPSTSLGAGRQGTSGFFVEKTIDREDLWEIQTPQVFRRDLIAKAYKRFKDADVTDDAALIEKLGVKVALVVGSYENIKITTPEDSVLVEAICRMSKYKVK